MTKVVMFAAAALLLLAGCATTSGAGYPAGANDLLAESLDRWQEHEKPIVIEELRESAELWPDPVTWYLLSRYQRDFGDDAGALDSLGQAIALDPGFAAAHYSRGEILLWNQELANREAALEDLEAAWRLRPERAMYGITLASELRWDKERSGEAEQIMDSLLQNSGDDPWTLLEVMSFKIDSGKLDQAAAIGKTLVELIDPWGDPYLLAYAVSGLYAAQLLEEARPLLISLLARELDDPWLLHSVGIAILEHSRDTVGAKQVYQQVLTSSYGPEGDMLFYAGLAELLAGGTDLAMQYLGEYAMADGSGDSVLVLVAAYAYAFAGGLDTQTWYAELATTMEQHWGKVEDKRKAYKWLDALLLLDGR